MGVKEVEYVLNESIDPQDLKLIEERYLRAVKGDTLTADDTFQYACSLIKSKYEDDINAGMILMKALVDDAYAGERECIYYLAVGNFRLKNYKVADSLITMVLQKEPNNSQAKDLSELIKSKQRRDGMIGAALLGGAALTSVGAIGAVAVGALVLLSRKK